MKSKFTTYTYEGIKGKTDLKAEYPYHGEWHTFSAHFGVTEEQYKADPQAYHRRVKLANEAYIQELQKKGEYLQPYYSTISLVHNPLFDK